ncbi:class V lanthionine synthetase subunit LxmK [Kitasatospora sp. NPDC001159]
MTIKEQGGEETEPTRLRLTPAALENAPEVNRLISSIGLGNFDPETVTAYSGRNENWAGITTGQATVFVKRLGGKPDDVAARFSRLTQFDQLTRRCTSAELRAPEILGTDSENHLIAFTWLADAQSGAELAADDLFTAELCRRAGRAVAALHRLPTGDIELDDTAHPLPPMDSLRALPYSVFANSSFAELEFWRLLQSDEPLLNALGQLRNMERAAPRSPIHGDLRLDQFLLLNEEMYLTDWEEFRLGDPARDVGGFIGEWLYRAVQGIPKSVALDSEDFGRKAAHEEIVAHGVAELERLRPKMAEFWSAYRAESDSLEDQFATRAVGYAGWHMLDRMLAAATGAARLSAADRAGAGIGRSILLSPAGFTGVLGLDGANCP